MKLGIEAPRQIRVLRNELLEDVQQENLRAAAAAQAAPAPFVSVLQRFGRVSRHSVADAKPAGTRSVAPTAESPGPQPDAE